MYCSAYYYAAAVALLRYAEVPIDRGAKWDLQNGLKMGQMVDFESPKYTSWNSFENSGKIRILRGFQIRPQTSSNLCCRGGNIGTFGPIGAHLPPFSGPPPSGRRNARTSSLRKVLFTCTLRLITCR